MKASDSKSTHEVIEQWANSANINNVFVPAN